MPLALSFGQEINIPVVALSSLEFNHDEEAAIVSFANGEKTFRTNEENILEVTSIIGTMQLNVADIDKISFRQQKKASPKGLLKSGAMPKKNLAWISPLSLNNPSCKRVPALVESTPYNEAFHHQAYQANPRIRLRHSHF